VQPSEEIKQKLDIVDVLKDYIQLKPAGMNFRAICPFHKEKTPSFMVSPDKQIYHCFGCGKGGDMFSFVMEMEGIDFREALRVLAPKAGVTLRQVDPKLQSQRNRVMDIIDWSRRYYHEQLINFPASQKAREYLEKRGLKKENIEEWQIGYSPDTWDSTINFLKSKGYKDNEIFLAGMIVKSNKSSRYYDRFRGRIMFPINDVNGNTVAFSARVSPEKEATEKMGKYINSPQTEAYDKSKILFGLDKAKMEIKKQDQTIIVEGQMDAITAQVAGWKNTVASSGTALTAEQIQLLKRYSDNIVLAFDQDKAGAMAADRGIRTAMQSEMSIKVIELPEGQDPDDCIRKDKKVWEDAIKNAKSMMQYNFDRVLGPLNLSDPENKRKAAGKLLPIIIQLGSRIEQDYWIKYMAEKLDVAEHLLREAIGNIKKPTQKQNKEDNKITTSKQVPQKRELIMAELLLALIFKYPALLNFVIDSLVIEQLPGEQIQALYKKIILYYNKINKNKNEEIGESVDLADFDYQNFKTYLESDNQFKENNTTSAQIVLLNRLVFLGDESYAELDYDEAKKEIREIILFLKKVYLKKQMKIVENLITEADKKGIKDEVNRLMEEFKILTDELQDLG
jgi:DNA primase